jgi:hypothetical protein
LQEHAWRRTSVRTAAHIKTNLDAAAINVMRSKAKKPQNLAKRPISTGPADPEN